MKKTEDLINGSFHAMNLIEIFRNQCCQMLWLSFDCFQQPLWSPIHAVHTHTHHYGFLRLTVSAPYIPLPSRALSLSFRERERKNGLSCFHQPSNHLTIHGNSETQFFFRALSTYCIISALIHSLSLLCNIHFY